MTQQHYRIARQPRLSGVTASMARVRYLDDPNPEQSHMTIKQTADFNALNTTPGAGH